MSERDAFLAAPGAPEFVSPVWVRLENGKPADHSTGLVPPDPLRAVWG